SVNGSPQGAIRGGFAVSPQNSGRFARCASYDVALARARRERRASSMSAAWDGCLALSPVPWGREAERRLTAYPAINSRPRWLAASASATRPSLLSIGATAREERQMVQARRRCEPSPIGSRVGVGAGVGGSVDRRGAAPACRAAGLWLIAGGEERRATPSPGAATMTLGFTGAACENDGMGAHAHACPCCGHPTLGERAGFEICPVCFWEDDGQDDVDAHVERGGPNRGT